MSDSRPRVRTLVECIAENATFGGRRISLLELLALPVTAAFPARELQVPWEQNRDHIWRVVQVVVRRNLDGLQGIGPIRATMIFDVLQEWGLTPLPQHFEHRAVQIAIAMPTVATGGLRERIAEAYRNATPRDDADMALLRLERDAFLAHPNREEAALRAIGASAAVSRRLS